MNALHATMYRPEIPLTSAVCITHSELKSRRCSVPIVPRSVKDTIDGTTEKFAACKEHDAHEFLSYLLDCMHDELEGEPNRIDEPVPTADFYTKIKRCLRCRKCGYSR